MLVKDFLKVMFEDQWIRIVEVDGDPLEESSYQELERAPGVWISWRFADRKVRSMDVKVMACKMDWSGKEPENKICVSVYVYPAEEDACT